MKLAYKLAVASLATTAISLLAWQGFAADETGSSGTAGTGGPAVIFEIDNPGYKYWAADFYDSDTYSGSEHLSTIGLTFAGNPDGSPTDKVFPKATFTCVSGEITGNVGGSNDDDGCAEVYAKVYFYSDKTAGEGGTLKPKATVKTGKITVCCPDE